MRSGRTRRAAAVAAAMAAAAFLGASGASGAPRGTMAVTVATANLTATESQAYEDAGMRILKALRPDVLGIQEFNYRRGTPQDLVYDLFGSGYYFTRERGGAKLPNGIISRYPILDSGQWEDPYIQNRNFVWAEIAIPGPKPLYVVSVHLACNRRDLRSDQAELLVRLIRKSFPKDAYVVLCGDLNTTSREAEAFGVLKKVFEDKRHPADQAGNKNTNVARNRPYDVVLASPALASREVPTELGGRSFRDGMVFDSRLWNPPPKPVKWDDTAQGMQHVPVMKTFAIPLRR